MSLASEPRIGVVGPGAMGLLHAAYLARSGFSITLLDYRRSRARRLSKEGFLLLRAETAETIADSRIFLPCRLARDLKRPFDIFLFVVKAYATAQAAADVSHLIAPHTIVISLQNGLGNVEALQKYQKAEFILAAVTTSGATLMREGFVVERGLGTISVGSVGKNLKLAQQMAALFAQAGLPAEAQADIWPVIWRKLAINCAINPLTALLNVPNGQLLMSPAGELMQDLAYETGLVAQALGVALNPEELPAATVEVCRLTADNISSMLQDIRNGRRTEIEQINGGVVERAQQLGLSAPLNRTMTILIKALEWQKQKEAQLHHKSEEIV